MIRFPLHLGERLAMREQIRRDALAQAEEDARGVGRSIKCRTSEGSLYLGPQHATDLDGCTNDGTSCLCECHDPAVES